MRALVTGASGFVGSHLLPHLHEKGFEIWASRHRKSRKYPFPVRWVPADLTRFPEVLTLIRRVRPDYIFHLAGQAVISEAWRDPGRTLQLNVLTTIFLLEGVHRFAPRARVLLPSSAQVYGATFLVKARPHERDLPNPLTPYGGSKLLMELVALNYGRLYNVDVVIARPSNQVGTGQNPRFVFSDFSRQVALIEKGKRAPVVRVGDAGVVRDFIHIRDAVRAYDLLARRGEKGGIYNVSSGRGTCLERVLDFLKKESRVPFRVKRTPSRFQPGDLPRVVTDPSKLRRLGWSPRESIWNGLREILEAYRENHQDSLR